MANIFWSEEIVARLTEHWKEGYSCSQIADKLAIEFNIELSRSAVIGKLNRMGMKSNVEVTRIKNRQAARRTMAKTGKKPAPVLNPKPTRVMSGMFVGGGGNLPPVEPLPKEDVPPADLVKFDDLTSQSCRWIYGDVKDTNHGYCGKQVVPGQSWCSHHCRRVFQPPVVRHRAPAPVRIPTFEELENA